MKRIFKAVAVLFVGLTFLACARELPVVEETVEAESKTAESGEKPTLIPGRMIVEFSEEMTNLIEDDLAAGRTKATKSSVLNAVFTDIKVKSVERVYPDAGEWEPRHREAGLHHWYFIDYEESGEVTKTKALSSMEEIDGVVFVEPERRIKSTATFNDPDLYLQWGYYNDGTLSGNHVKGCDINVTPVWENYTGGKSDVIVSVVDGGIDLSHYDLAAVSLPGGSSGSKNFVRGNFVIVPHSHGTHVAGTIGAINNNKQGGCGIAGGLDGNGGVTLMSCQVFEDNPDDPKHDLTGNFYDAIVWGADHGAVISQNSWGHVYENAEDAAAGGVGGSKGAIDYFIKYAGTDKNGNQTGPMKGGVVIFAAGNDGWPDGWPAEYEAVVAVGAVSPAMTRASYSNYGAWVDLAAPGGDASYGKGLIYSTIPGGEYGNMQGTSMACPHVSGVAALIVSQFGGPGFTNEMLLERLLGGARDVLPASANIGPLVDAYGSFTYGSKVPPDAVSSFSVEAASNNVTYTWNVTADSDDGKAFGYVLLASQDRSVLESLDPKNIPSSVGRTTVMVESLKVGAEMTGTVTDLSFETDYYVAIVGYDYNRNYSSLSPIKTVKTGTNTPPVVTASETGKIEVRAFQTKKITFNISDPDGHSFTVSFDGGSEAATATALSTEKYQVEIVGNAVEHGTYTGIFTVKDKFGAETVYEFEYEIIENQAPVVVKEIESQVYEQMGLKIAFNMDEYIVDPDGETLTYTIQKSNNNVVHINQADNVLNMTTLGFGMVDIVITGKDAKGLTVTLPFQVLVRAQDAAPDIYPTRVTDKLYVSDGGEKSLTITLTSSAGAVLYNETVVASSFEPAVIDMSKYAPGRYAVKVVSEDSSVTRTIVKL